MDSQNIRGSVMIWNAVLAHNKANQVIVSKKIIRQSMIYSVMILIRYTNNIDVKRNSLRQMKHLKQFNTVGAKGTI